jgi:hypothetical protein
MKKKPQRTAEAVEYLCEVSNCFARAVSVFGESIAEDKGHEKVELEDLREAVIKFVDKCGSWMEVESFLRYMEKEVDGEA